VEAGLHSGDVIVKIDGKSSLASRWRRQPHACAGRRTSVTLTVKREGEAENLDVHLTRREIVTKSVAYSFMVEGDVGYIRLANFSEKSGAEVREALARLHSSGADA